MNQKSQNAFNSKSNVRTREVGRDIADKRVSTGDKESLYPNNTHFDTTRANMLSIAVQKAVDSLVCDVQSTYHFKSNMDTKRLVLVCNFSTRPQLWFPCRGSSFHM